MNKRADGQPRNRASHEQLIDMTVLVGKIKKELDGMTKPEIVSRVKKAGFTLADQTIIKTCKQLGVVIKGTRKQTSKKDETIRSLENDVRFLAYLVHDIVKSSPNLKFDGLEESKLDEILGGKSQGSSIEEAVTS